MRKIPFAGIELTSQRVKGYMVPLSYRGDRYYEAQYHIGIQTPTEVQSIIDSIQPVLFYIPESSRSSVEKMNELLVFLGLQLLELLYCI